MHAIKTQENVTGESTAKGDLKTVSRRVCHDLLSPINTVRLTLNLLAHVPENDAAGRVELIDTAQAAMDDLVALVGRLRLITEASSGGIAFEPVDAHACFAQAAQSLQSQGFDGWSRTSFPVEAPVMMGVGAWFREICEIFLKNAYQHAGPEARVVVKWRRHRTGVRFMVCDDGFGIEETFRDGLFTPFENLHSAYSSRGLGLSIAERLVKAMGGACGYEPLAPHGSVFFFDLPREYVEEGSPKAPIGLYPVTPR